MGPNARALLAGLTDADLSQAAFAFGRAARSRWRKHRCAQRASAMSGVAGTADTRERRRPRLRRNRGDRTGVRTHAGGMHAMDSLRLEKAFRHWATTSATRTRRWRRDSPSPARSGSKPPSSAATRCSRKGARPDQTPGAIRARRSAAAAVSQRAHLPRRCDGRYLTSGSYGHTLGRSVGLGYVRHPDGVDAAFVNSGSYAIEIAGERHAARASLAPLYDPKGERMRA